MGAFSLLYRVLYTIRVQYTFCTWYIMVSCPVYNIIYNDGKNLFFSVYQAHCKWSVWKQFSIQNISRWTSFDELHVMNELHLSPISGKSLLYISYHADQQHEVKLLKQSLDLAGFDCVGDWILAGKTGQELNEKRRNLIAGSSLFLAFITPQ